MTKTSHYLKFILSILLLALSVFLCARIIYQAKENQAYRNDLAEVNSIQYGLLNVDEWKVHLSNILSKKVEEFELTDENQEKLKPQVENILYALLDEVELILKSDVAKLSAC